MRCLLVVPIGWAHDHLYSGLQAVGIQCERFILSTSMGRPRWPDFGGLTHRRNLDLKRIVQDPRLRPDIAMFVAYDDCLEIETLKTMRKLGVRTVCLHVDMVSQWYRVLRTGPYFDLVWCAQKIHVDKLRSRGIRAEYLPMAAVETPLPNVYPSEDACYVGGLQSFRVGMLKKVAEMMPLSIYGIWDLPVYKPSNGWKVFFSRFIKSMFDLKYFLPKITVQRCLSNGSHPSRSKASLESLNAHYKGYIDEKNVAGVIAAARLNLGFTYMGGHPFTKNEVRQCRLREFSIPLLCANGPYLTQGFEELHEIYEPDEEILVWNTPGEFEDKIKQVISNPGWAREVARKGRKKVLSKHLWQHRFKTIFEILGISTIGKTS